MPSGVIQEVFPTGRENNVVRNTFAGHWECVVLFTTKLTDARNDGAYGRVMTERRRRQLWGGEEAYQRTAVLQFSICCVSIAVKSARRYYHSVRENVSGHMMARANREGMNGAGMRGREKEDCAFRVDGIVENISFHLRGLLPH